MQPRAYVGARGPRRERRAPRRSFRDPPVRCRSALGDRGSRGGDLGSSRRGGRCRWRGESEPSPGARIAREWARSARHLRGGAREEPSMRRGGGGSFLRGSGRCARGPSAENERNLARSPSRRSRRTPSMQRRLADSLTRPSLAPRTALVSTRPTHRSLARTATPHPLRDGVSLGPVRVSTRSDVIAGPGVGADRRRTPGARLPRAPKAAPEAVPRRAPAIKLELAGCRESGRGRYDRVRARGSRRSRTPRRGLRCRTSSRSRASLRARRSRTRCGDRRT